MSRKNAADRALVVAVVTASALVAGCETVPDPCADYPLACIGVTVDRGPADVYRVRVNLMDGLDSYTVLTPKKEPKAPLVYPLRFAIRFGDFDNRFRGEVSFVTSALDQDFDIIGETSTTTTIMRGEKKALTISLGPAPPEADMSTPPDLSTPGPVHDLGPGPAPGPDMP